MPSFLAPDGTSLHFKDWGKGQPVVLLSSWFLDSDMWEFQYASLLAAGFRCIALDRRGHGRSDQPDGPYDYDTLASDIDALFRHLDLTQAVIVGQSMGGAEALRYLSTYGTERVRALITVGSTIPYMQKTDEHPLGVDPELLQASIDWIARDRFEWTNAGIGGFFGEGLVIEPRVVEWVIAMTWRCSYRAMVECQRTVGFTDLREDARKADLPALVIVGSMDQSTTVELNSEAVELMPNAKMSVYEGAAHALYITHAERLNKEIVAFINGTSE